MLPSIIDEVDVSDKIYQVLDLKKRTFILQTYCRSVLDDEG